MWFWITVVVAALVALWAARIGLFETCALGFNVLVSVYVALQLTPWLLEVLPQAGDIPAGVMVTCFATAVLVFAALHATCFFLITSQFKVPFPKACDVVLAGMAGFVIGLLGASFVLVALNATAGNATAGLLEKEALAPNHRCLCWWGDGLHAWVRRSGTRSSQPTEDALARIEALTGYPRAAPLPLDPNAAPTAPSP